MGHLVLDRDDLLDILTQFQLHDMKETVMAAIDDLTAAVASLDALVQTAVTAIQSLEAQVASGGATNDAAIADATGKINADIATVQAALPATPTA